MEETYRLRLPISAREFAVTEALPIVYLARHGETAWTLSGQHTGRTDLPLTEHGEEQARALGQRLGRPQLAKVLTSPAQRARRTAELAGFGDAAEIDPDLAEWDYGRYEGRRTAEIHAERPDWQLFRDGCPEEKPRTGGHASRPDHPPRARHCGRRDPILQRALSASPCGALVGSRSSSWSLLPAGHCQPWRTRL